MAEKILFCSVEKLREIGKEKKDPGLHRPLLVTSVARKACSVVPQQGSVQPDHPAVVRWAQYAAKGRPSAPLPPRSDDANAAPDDAWPSAKRRRLSSGDCALNPMCSVPIGCGSQLPWPPEISASVLQELGPSEPSVVQEHQEIELPSEADCRPSVATAFTSSHLEGASNSADGSPKLPILKPVKILERVVQMMLIEAEKEIGNRREHHPMEMDAAAADEDMDF